MFRLRSSALALLTAAAALLLLWSTVIGRSAELAFSMVAVAFPVLLIIAALSRVRTRRVLWLVLLLLALLEGSLLGMWALRGAVPDSGWFLGLPQAAAIQIYGLFVIPLFVVALGFAMTFDSFGVSAEDLDRLRELSRGEQR